LKLLTNFENPSSNPRFKDPKVATLTIENTYRKRPVILKIISDAACDNAANENAANHLQLSPVQL
jgi:hypothetical protein